MECDICGFGRQGLVRVEVPRRDRTPAMWSQVCPCCLTYEMLRALVIRASLSPVQDLKPVA